jgi:hypothetical protein
MGQTILVKLSIFVQYNMLIKLSSLPFNFDPIYRLYECGIFSIFFLDTDIVDFRQSKLVKDSNYDGLEKKKIYRIIIK